VLVVGLSIGTAFTLFFVPAIYLLIARDHHKERLLERERQAGLGAPPSPAPAP
jgi:multidrug efflux pump